ncbi:MAG: glycosyltransferase [Sphingomonas sp.]
MNIRVAIAFDNFGPYHVARLTGAAQHADVLAVETASSTAEYAWNAPRMPSELRHVALFNSASAVERSHFPAAIEHAIGPFAPDAVAVPGWSSATSLEITRWAVKRKIPVIAMSETNAWDFRRNSAIEFLKRRIAAHFSAGLCTSDSQAAYLQSLGLSPGAVFRGYNAVDNDYFAREGARARDGEMPDGGAGPIPPGARGRYFLASCRFIPKKNLALLLDAYARFRHDRADDRADWPLVLLGDGELRPALDAQRAALRLTSHVHMPGFRQYDALPRYYGTAGCFVHASLVEQWGLVVNEAMASGLPIIVSDRCGCAPTLVKEGVNGHRFPATDPGALADAMRSIAALPNDTAMRAASSAIIADWGPDRFGRGMADALAYVADAPRPHPSRIDAATLTVTSARMSLR